jgi:hypothetical protein
MTSKRCDTCGGAGFVLIPSGSTYEDSDLVITATETYDSQPCPDCAPPPSSDLDAEYCTYSEPYRGICLKCGAAVDADGKVEGA